MNKWPIVGLVGSAVIGFLILTATVSRDEATSNVASWLGWLFLLGFLLLVIPMIIASIRLYRRLMTRLDQTVPAAPPADHWAHRKRLEISVLANVSAGRQPTESPIDKDPEDSRLRELKDAIDAGELDAQNNEYRANAFSTVTLADFELYVAATNKPYWIEVLHRWQAVQNPAPGKPSDELKEKRIPLLKFLEIARSHGWNVLEPSGYEGYDLIHGISEGAGLGDIALLGKIVDTQLPSFTPTGRLKRIPVEFWSNHEIDPMTCFELKNPGVVVRLKSDNLETQTKHDGGTFIALGNYADLHIETDGLMEWLKTDAESSRGHHQRTYGD